MIKRFLALSAAAAIVGVTGVFAIGWALAAPVQTHVGKPPEDLGARPVEFKSDSGANGSRLVVPDYTQPRRGSAFARHPR